METPDWADRLSHHQAALSRKEQELVEWIGANPHVAAFARLNELAELAVVSKPTIISCYRQLGYLDYQEFQAGLQGFYAGQIDSYHASAVALKEIVSVDGLIEACLSVETAALELLRKNLDSGQLDQIITAILAAPTVHVYGDGTGFYPGHYLVQRLRSCGVHACLAGTDREHVLEELGTMAQGDLFLTFNYTQDAFTLARIMDFCVAQGAKVALVTGFLDPQLCQKASWHLFIPRGQLNFKNSMALPMAFAQILLLGVELRGGEALGNKLKQLGMLRKGMKQTIPKERS